MLDRHRRLVAGASAAASGPSPACGRTCGTGGITLVSGDMTERAPIHVGSGEPMLLLHPFMMSQNVWKTVAPLIAGVDEADPAAPATGRYEVLAPTMLSHNGGPRGPFFLSSSALADDVERRLDAMGWGTVHIVGNSLGGWVAFELERRGRARTLTGIAPAGGWTRYTPAKFEIVGKFLAGIPLWLLTLVLGPRVLRLPFARQLGSLPVSARPDGLSDQDLLDIVDDVSHCPAYYQLLVKALLLPGLMELAEGSSPTHLIICERDRVLPHPRFTRHFTAHLPEDTRITHLDGVGHIPMFEAPGRIADLIVDFVDSYATPPNTKATG
jgi:pimeloyl-ACP methyl ester carboxylesterase